MKKTAYLLVALALTIAAPVFAQGPFTDVPTDHWAYDAANTLQKDGVLIGYPDGTFGGKRTITRYEFAAALARLVQMIPGQPGGQAGVTQAQLEAALAGKANKSDIPAAANLANLATKADVEALRKLVDEFRDELAALGVDVDALKRDVAALCARVDALEAEVRRVRFTGDATIFGIAGATTGGQAAAIDLDQRELRPSLGRNITYVQDFDLNVVGRVNCNTTANATINYGNYLNYLGAVDDYVDGFRPVDNTPGPGFGGDLSDTFFPYYLYIETALGKGNLTAGRMPIQFTPYTLKKIDVDSYTNILKTDDGNYPIDGVKLGYNFGGVDLTLFASKNEDNDFLANGLTGQPKAGIYTIPALGGTFHQGVNGNAVGGLNQVSQTAGVRGVVGIPGNGVLGGTFYQAWDRTALLSGWDQAQVFGGDLSIGVPFLGGVNFAGSWTQSNTLGTSGAFADVDYGNVAWDGKFSFNFAGVGIGAGYKDIGRNFAAAGYWDKIGRWTNPTDVKGPYADINYVLMDNVKLNLNGEWLTGKDDVNPGGGLPIWLQDDELVKAEGAVKWGFTKNNTLDVSYQWVRFNPTDSAAAITSGFTNDSSTESYLTVGLGHQMSPNAGIKLGYQFISYNGNALTRPYYTDYRGGLGVVQFGVSF